MAVLKIAKLGTPALRLREASGVPASQRAALLEGTFEVDLDVHARGRLRIVFLPRVAAVLHAPDASLVDAGVALFVTRERTPELATVTIEERSVQVPVRPHHAGTPSSTTG